MRHSSFSRARAFTLAETVIVVGIASAMMVALGLLILMFNKSSNYGKAVLQSSGSASALMSEARALLFQADSVLQSHTFGGTVYTASSSALVLRLPSIDASGNIVSNTYDYAVVYVASTSVYRRIDADAQSKRASGTKLLSNALLNLSITYNNVDYSQVDTVTIDVQTRVLVKGDAASDHRREQIRLRNR